MNLYIKSLKRDVQSGLVKSIVWFASKVSEDGQHRAETKGEQFLAPKSPSDESFIEYSQIDASTAENWLRQSLTDDGINNIEQYLDAVISQKTKESVAFGKPWEPSVIVPNKKTASTQSFRRTSFPVIQSE